MRNEFCAWYRKLTFTPTTHFDLRVNMWYSLVIMFATSLCKQNTSVWRLECGCCQSCWLCVTMCDIGWLWVVVIRCGCIAVAVVKVKVAAHSTEIEVDGSLIRGIGRSWGHIVLYCMVDRLCKWIWVYHYSSSGDSIHRLETGQRQKLKTRQRQSTHTRSHTQYPAQHWSLVSGCSGFSGGTTTCCMYKRITLVIIQLHSWNRIPSNR